MSIPVQTWASIHEYVESPSHPPEREDKVIAAVRDDLLRRSQLGIRKYNTTLDENPAEHIERLQHAYEEALDLANYLKWSIMRLTDK